MHWLRLLVVACALWPIADARAKPSHAAKPFPGLGKPDTGIVDAVVLDAQGFDTGQHPELFKELANQNCTKVLGDAQWYQDFRFFYVPAAHFDNCAFKDSLQYVQERLGEADQSIIAARAATGGAALKLLDQAIRAVGRGAHGIQDFYSHSTFVEWLTVKHKSFDDGTSLDLWTPEHRDSLLRALAEMKLISGVVSYELPNSCPAKQPDHEQLNKDSNDTLEGRRDVDASWAAGRNYHLVALDLARDATKRYLSYVFKRWPELRKHCDGKIGIIVTFDQRR